MPVLVGAGIVIAALFALAVMHALLIGGQIRLDDMQREVASDTEEVRRLRLRVAELEAPHRVLDVARDRLGMVQPVEVGYLAPAEVQLPDADPVSVAPAERPAPVPTGEELGTDADDAPAGDDDAAAEESTDETTDDATYGVVDESTAPTAGGGDE